MKKFMIFLLMTVLYLGTCQARSEASHPNNGKLKLLSWVSPTPSESFLTPAGAPTSPVDVTVKSGDGAFSVAIVGAGSMCKNPGNDGVTLTAVVGGPISSPSVAYVWYFDGTAITGANNQYYDFNSSTLPAAYDGNVHDFFVEVTVGVAADCAVQRSPKHFFISPRVVDTISGPLTACANADLTLTANLMFPVGATVTAWQWFQGGSTSPYATTSENTITLSRDVLGTFNWHVEPIFSDGPTCMVTPINTWNASSVQNKNVTGTLGLSLATSSHTPMCEGNTISLVPDPSHLTLTNVTGNPSYEWYMNGELVATTTSASPAYTTTMQNAGVYTFVVKAVYENYDCSEIASAPLTVTVYAAPALAIVGDNVICAGQSENEITATSDFESYIWTNPAGTPETKTGTNANKFNANAPGHYTLTATTAAANGGCEATSDFTVYQFGGDLQLTASNYYVCPGEVVALNANLDGWSNENIQYTWTIPTGATIQGATNASVATVQIDATASGTLQFKVKATANNIAACEIEKTINVNVIAPTNATFAVALDKADVCEGGQVKATATLTGTYTGLLDWYVNGVQVPGEHATVITLNMNEAGTYTFAATPANTVCTNAVPSVTPTAANTVNVHANPVVTLVGDHVICVDETPNTITAMPNVAANTYTWTAPNGATASAVGAFTLPATLPGTYLVTMTDANNCSGSDQFTVTQLGADLQVYASETTVCPGTPVILNANVDGWDNYDITYEWDHSLGTNPTVTVNTPATGTYTVTAYAKEGGVTICQKTASVSLTVINETAPTVTVSRNSAENICQGGIAQYTATASGGSAASISGWKWFLDGVEIPGQNLATVYVNLYDTGVHHFSAQPLGFECIAPGATSSDKTTKVYLMPEVTISGNNQICDGTITNNISAQVIGGSGNYTYTWAVPTGATAAGNNATQNANKPGVYTLTVKDNTSGCQTEVDFTVYQSGADLQLMADKMQICKGEMVVLNANLDGFNNNVVSYTWTGNGIVAPATGSTVSAIPTAAGNQKYVVTATAGNCTMKDSVVVNVTQGTNYATHVVRHNGSEYCEGQQIAYFTASTTPASSDDALYTWYLDGVQIPGEDRANLFLNNVGIGSHYVFATAVVDGCNTASMSTETVNFSVHAAPEVTITGNNVICNGDTAVLTAHASTMAVFPSTGNSYRYTYAWSNGQTTTSTASTTNQIKVTEPGTYTVTVTNRIQRSGVWYNLCSTVATIEVTSFGGNIQMTVDNNAICLGETVVLNANLNGFNNENIEYAWTGNGLGTIATGSQVNATPTATGEQKYVVTASAGNCEMKDSVIVTVHEIPSNPSLSLSDHNICVGEQVTLTADNTGAGSNYTYTWYQDGVVIPGENTREIILTLTEVGEHMFRVSRTNAYGCTSALTTPTNSTKVTVHAAPEFTLTGNNIICNGQTAEITATPATYTYTWVDGTAGGSANIRQYQAAGAYAVTATLNGCTSTQTFNIYTNGSDLQVYADRMEVCDGEMVTLDANLDGFTADNISYEWTGTGLISNIDGSTVTTAHGSTVAAVPTTTNHSYTVVASTTGANPGCTVEGHINITVHAIPENVTSVTASKTNVCEGDFVTLTASNNVTDAVSYIWYQDGIEIAGENQRIINVNVNEAGNHTFAVKAVNAYGCVSAAVASVTVNVYAVPVLAITGDNFVCAGQVGNMIYATEGFNEYSWLKPDGATENTGTTNNLNAFAPGQYHLTATMSAANGGCVAHADFTVTQFGSDLQLTADRMEICKGEFVVLNANLDGFNNELVNYAWTGNGLGTIATGSTVTATPTAAGEQKYVVTATAGPCTKKDSLMINVIDVVVVTTTVTANATICEGGQATLTATPNPANAATEFIWYMNGVEIPGENQPVITMNMNQAGAYTFAAKAVVDGCDSATVSDNVTITVDAIPVVTLTGDHYYTTDITSAKIMASVTPAGNYTYEWSNGETRTKANHDTITVSAPGGYGVYTVTVTSANGCSAISDPFTVSSVVDLQAYITGAEAACQHDVVTLSAVVDYDLEGHTYRWMVNNQYITDAHGITGSTTAHLVFPVDSLYQYYGQVLSNEFTVEIVRPGCDSVVKSPVHPFLITPVPYVYVAAPEKICKGQGTTLQAVVYQLGENAQYQYEWFSKHSGTVTSLGTFSYVNTYDVASDKIEGYEYAVRVIYQDLACNSDTSDYVSIPFYTEPQPITLNIDPSTICSTNQASVWITDPNTDPVDFGAVNYTWYVNGFEMPLAQGDTLVVDFDHNGDYTFWATAAYANYPCALAYTDTLTENVVMHPTVAITGDALICHGDTINLYANINDTVGSMTYTYEWRLYNYSLEDINNNNIAIGSSGASNYINNGNTTFNVSGADNPWLTVFDVNAQDYPYVYTVVVTTPEGCRVESDPYFVYVNDTIHVVATVDYDSVCAEGIITATAHLGNWNADNLTAQWQYSIDNGTTWNNIDYGTSGILQHIPGHVVTALPSVVLYRIHVVQTTSGCEAYSNAVPVKVFQPLAIDHVVAINHDDNYPTDKVCEGAQLDVTAYILKLDASGNPIPLIGSNGLDSLDANGNVVYETYIDSSLTYMWELNGMVLPDIHGPAFSAQAYIYDSDPVDYTYTAYIVYNIPGCEKIKVASNTVHVRRNPIVIIEGNHNFCYGLDMNNDGVIDNNVVLTAWVDGDYDPDATYTWFKNGEYRPNTDGFNNHYSELWEPTYDNPYEFTVEVTNGDGCTTISEIHYVNVYDKPFVHITSDADSICENGSVTMQANLENYNDPMLTFQWYRNEVNEMHIIEGATHETETFYPVLGTTNYIVLVTHLMEYQQPYQTCVALDTFQIKVNPIPVVTAEYRHLPNNVTSICDGRAVNIAAGVLPNTGIAGGEVYTWYRNGEVINGFNGDTLVDYPMSVDNEPAVYTYAVSVKQSAAGCESEIFTLTPSITVNPNPVLELTTDPIVCDTAGNNITLTANMVPTTVGSDLQYSWYEDNHLLAGFEIPTDTNAISFHKDYRDYPYSFSVKTVNAFGCISEASALVYVNAEPVVHITATEDSICVGGEVTLTATLNDWNADQLTFQWFDGNDSIQGATELSYTVVPTQGTHKYHVEILQLTSLCHAESDTVTVNVVADPTITITYAAAQYTVCDGYQVDLTTTVTGGVAGGEVYTWYRNGQVIEGATSATYSEVVSALNGEPTTYDYAVSVKQAAAGCESNVYDQLNTITVNPNPVVVLVTDPIVCDTTGNNITLTANMDPANVGSTVTFKWMEDNAIMDPATYTVAANNQIKLHKAYRDYPYNFSVEVVNDYACSASSEAQVYVNANPIVNTTVTEDSICVGGEITMTASLNDWNADMLTFQWYDNNQPIPGATSLSYTVVPAEGNHSYTVKVFQLTSECEATSTPLTVVVKPDPIVTLVSVSDDNVCNGAQITVAATIDAHGMNTTGAIYTWYRNGILIPGATAATIQDNPSTIDNNIQHYTYTAVVTLPQAGCTSLPTTSDAVTVYPNPVVVISGDAHVCETDTVFLIANVDTTAFAVGNLHFTWYESGTIHDNMAYNLGDSRFFAEYFYPRDEPYVFTVNVERDDISAACAAMSAEYYVYVYPQPLVTVTATETLVCTDGEVTLTANLADYNADNLIYQWYEIRQQEVITANTYVNDVYSYDTAMVDYRYYIPGATMPTYTTNPHTTTTYGVVVYQTNSTCWNDDEVTITVNPIPAVTAITVSNDTVCDGTQVTVSATIDTYGTPADGAVYTWYRNGDLIEGVTGASFSENVFTTDDHITVNSYTAVVTLPVSGCVSLESNPNTVTILPAPTTVSISGNNVICENDSTTLTVYSNVPGNITWSTGSHENTITVPAGVYTVTVETLGCQMTSEPFTVEALGTDLLVSASATSICRGEHTTLYVNQDGWQGNVTYLWDAQAGNSTATTVDVQPDSTTTYHVTATVSSTNGTCSIPGEVTIIVNQLPAAFAVTASADTICEGQQVTFTAPVDPQVTGYIWYQNGVEIPGENQNTITVNFNEYGNYTFAAKAISLEGCISAEASAPVTVTVTPAPTTVTITGVNILCENSTTTLTAHSDVEGTWTWSNGSHESTITVPAGTYNVTMTTAQGCSMTSENFTVEAFGTDLIVSASATAICEGEHTTLYVDQNGWQGNVTYAWDAQAGNSTSPTVDVQPATTTTYHVTATVSSTNGTCQAEGEVTIVVTPRPAQVVVTASVDTICQGQQITFNASGNAYSYIWYQNGVEMAGENQASITVNFNEAGNYTFAAKAVNDQNCESAVASLPVTVTVNPAPTTVTITGVNILCENSTTTLTAHSDVEGTWTWSNGSHESTITVPAGTYNVTMTTAEGCSMTSELFTVEAFGTDLIVSASETSICRGEHTTLYVDQEGWQGNVTYQWDAQAGNDTASTVDVQPAQTTTYHVTATVHSTNGTCQAEGFVTIIVNQLPVITGVTASDTVICQGQQVTFTATGDANTVAYIWYNNGVEIPGENQAALTVNFNEAGVYNYAVKAISNENCLAAVAYNAPVVTVNPAPTTVTITGVNILCENSTTTLTAHSDVEGTWTWSNGSHESTITVPAGTYNVTMTTPEGCSMTSELFTVEAFGTDLLVSASETNICEGEHTTLYVNQEGWQGNVTYLWDVNADSSVASTVDVQPATTTTYHVTATVSSTNGTCQATGEVTINVNPKPAAPAVVVPYDTVCVGTQIPVIAMVPDNTIITWYVDGIEVPGENTPQFILNAEPGVHYVTARQISDQGCVSDLSAPFTTLGNTVYYAYYYGVSAPESVTISGELNICDGGSTTLYANVVPNEPATYVWYKDNVAANTTTDHLTVTEAGSYKVVASFNGCSTESDPVNVMVGETPQVELTATESTICVGGTTVITAEATGPNNIEMNYNWENGFQGSAYTFTPAAAGTYTFMVTVSQATNGCTAADTIDITVNAVPATPVVTVDHAVVCDGGQVTLTVTNAIANATYTWTKNNTVIGTGAVLLDSPATVDGDETGYVYTVVAELPMSGCISETSANTVVTVIPTPVVELSVDGNTTLCAGGSTTIYANVTPANPNYTYQWYKDNVLIDGATEATYTAADAARETAYNYKVVVSANAGCDVTSAPLAITFVADPQVEAIISNNISCVGGTATLTAVVDGGIANVNGLNGYHFAWHRNYAISTDPNAPHSTEALIGDAPTYTTSANDAAGNYSYWVTVTSNYGCESTSLPVNYSVVADPVVTITVANGYPTTVCDGGASMLTANVSGGYGEATYQWYKNNNLLVGETNQTLSLLNMAYNVNDTYMVEVMQTGVGCSNVATAAINTLVTVHPTYTVDITGFGNVCEGGTLTLNATVNGGQIIAGDVLSYQWYRIVNGADAVAIAGANAASYSTSDLLLGNSYDYYVVVTSSISGCSVVSNSVPANVVTAPTVAIQGANTVCEGGNLTLNAFVNGGVDGAAYIYIWNWTGAANGSDTTAVPTFVPTLAANDLATPYYFTVTISRNDNTGCTATSEAHEVNVLAIPTVSVTADNSYICQNGEVTFTAHVSPVGAYNYVWTINGQQQAENAATITTTMATTGTINATVVVSAANASGSCSATATIATPVQVVAIPTVTLAANNTTMCVGGVTTLTATVNANANIPGNFNYEWIVDGAPIAGVTNILNQTLNTAGVHTYQVRVSQNNNLGCASSWSNMATVQVAEQPVVTLNSEDGLAICEGGSITLTGVVTNYNNTVNGVTNSAIYGNMVFDWTSNGVNIHHNTSNNAMNQVTETLNTIGNYTYQVTVDAAGYNCLPQISNEYTVNVVSDPTWTDVHVYSNNGTDACLGEMVYLMANIEGGAVDYSAITGGHIQWVVTDENGNTIDVNGGLGGNSYDIPTAAGTYIYTPTFVGNIGSGCQLANTNDVQVAVTVHELPTAEFTSGDGTALCANDPSASAALVISFTGVAPFTYEVVDNNNNVIAHATTYANTATIYVAPEHQTTYRINLISDNYCENPAIGDAITATVYVNEIEFTENVFDAACDANEVTITFNMISGNPTAAFTVVYENGMQASGNIVNNTATFTTPTTAGSYNAVITIDGCSYDIVVRVPMTGYSYSGTLPLMDQRWNDVVVVNCNPETNGGHTFVGFQWYHNGVAIPGATYSNYQDKGGLNGFYSVELTEQTADGRMITYMACEQYFDGTSSVKVYPVPANVRQEITIELDLTSEQLNGAVLDIYSVTGAHISHLTDLQPITKIEGFTAQGTYFGRILTGTNEIKTVKFIIVK